MGGKKTVGNIPRGTWFPGAEAPAAGAAAIREAIRTLPAAVALVRSQQGLAAAGGGRIEMADDAACQSGGLPLAAWAPALTPDLLGDPGFRRDHGLRYAYVMGAMANAIASVDMVEAAGNGGMIGFFGAAGLEPADLETAIDQLRTRLGERPWGCNLIHSPGDPQLEQAVVDLYLRHAVRRVSASAYLQLTPPLVEYRAKGIRRLPDGTIQCPNRVLAKVSRVEIAERFFSPPPAKILDQLVDGGRLTREEAELAARVPLAEDLTAEADSGGHTDNRPAITLLPTMLALRDRLAAEHGFDRPLRVGLGGGIATPESVAAAFAMGAAYVLTGSVNQACREAGVSPEVRRMLCEARQADVTMAPAADMFEMGVKVQVLKRGTMFAARAAKLYQCYRQYESYERIPEKIRAGFEKTYFRSSFEDAWRRTHAFFARRDPLQNERAARDPRHKMALVFRSYLGQSSGWAVRGEADRRVDYQIWCGPAMGAFNEWVRGTFLEPPEARDVVTVAMNLLVGGCVVIRCGWLRNQGVALPPGSEGWEPRPLSSMAGRLG